MKVSYAISALGAAIGCTLSRDAIVYSTSKSGNKEQVDVNGGFHK